MLLQTPMRPWGSFLLTWFLLLGTGMGRALSAEVLNVSNEFTPEVIFYSGDAARTATFEGFEYTYHINRAYWVGASFIGGKTDVDRGNGFGLTKGDKFIALLGGVYFNIPGLIGATREKKEEGLGVDLYTSVGGGNLWLGVDQHPMGFVGGGMLLYTGWHWLAVRFDLKGYFYRLKNSKGNDFNADTSFNIGPSFVF